MGYEAKCSLGTRLQVPECLYHWNETQQKPGPSICLNPTPYFFLRSMDKLTFHFPHFAQNYFKYISEMLQYPDRCVTYAVVSNSSHLARSLKRKEAGPWIHDMIDALDTSLHHSSMMIDDGRLFFNDSAERISLSFTHPAHGAILASLIQGTSPCPSKDIIKSNIRTTVSILQREKTRTIGNIEDVVKVVVDALPGRRVVSEIISFGFSDSLKTQVLATGKSDILISIHGAGLTNIFAMKPCTVLVEVFPFAFHCAMFRDLAQSIDLGYFSWEESQENCAYNSTTNDYCMTRLHTVASGVSPALAHRECSKDAECRRCMREAVKVHLNLTRLHETVQRAEKYYSECKMRHPYYKFLAI